MTSAASDSLNWRMAESADAMAVAPLIVEASGGIIPFLLEGLLPGTTPALLVAATVADEASPLGYPNILLAEAQAQVLAATVGYDSALYTLPETLTSFVPAERLDALQALMQTPLPKSFYIQCLAVDVDVRGQGLGRALLQQSEMLAQALDFEAISLHVWADNAPALALYASAGFARLAAIPMPMEERMGHRGGKYLLHKRLA